MIILILIQCIYKQRVTAFESKIENYQSFVISNDIIYSLWTNYQPFKYYESSIKFFDNQLNQQYSLLFSLNGQLNQLSYHIVYEDNQIKHIIRDQFSQIYLSYIPEIYYYDGVWHGTLFRLMNNQLQIQIIDAAGYIIQVENFFIASQNLTFNYNIQNQFPGYISDIYMNNSQEQYKNILLQFQQTKNYQYNLETYEDFYKLEYHYLIGFWMKLNLTYQYESNIIFQCNHFHNNQTIIQIIIFQDILEQQNSKMILITQNYSDFNIFKQFTQYIQMDLRLSELLGSLEDWIYIKIIYLKGSLILELQFTNSQQQQQLISKIYHHSYQKVHVIWSQQIDILQAKIISNLQYHPKYFQNVIKCHYSCDQCFGPYQHNCLTCNLNYNRVFKESIKQCVCLVGYIDQDNQQTCKDISVVYPNMKKTELDDYKSTCQPGQLPGIYECIPCPQIASDKSILCGNCYVNQQEFIQIGLCSFDFIRNSVNEGFRKIKRREQDYLLYSMDFDVNKLWLCDGCKSFCKDRTQINCFLSNYVKESQYLYISCKINYIFQNGQCIKCSNNCDVCDQSTVKCIQCQELHTLYQNDCIKCPDNCIKCQMNQSPQCEICKDGYYLKDNQCFQCESNCSICQFIDQQLKCLRCKQSDQFISGSFCLQNYIQNCLYQFEHKGIVHCALCENQFVNHLFYCEADLSLAEDEQIVVSKQQTYNIQKKYNKNQLIKQNCQIKFCHECIQNLHILNQYCIRCQIGYYANYINGQCYPCINDCYGCVQQNKFKQDFWRWDIFPFQHFILKYQNPVQSEADQEIICISCYENYELQNGKCIQECPKNCKKCQIENNQNVCIECLNSQFGEQLSIFDNQCIECTQYCAFCVPHESNNFNPQFQELLKYKNRCLLQFQSNDPQLRYDSAIHQFVNCPKWTLCLWLVEFEIKCYCDYSQFKNFGSGMDFYIDDIFSQDENSHFEKIEILDLIQYYNEESVRTINLNVKLIPDQQGICQIKPNTFVNSRLQQNIYNLEFYGITFYSDQPLTMILQAQLLIKGFNYISFNNLNIAGNNCILKLTDASTLTFQNGIIETFQNKQIQIQSQVIMMDFINMTFQNIQFQNTSFIQTRTNQSRYYFINIKILNCTFDNSSFLNNHVEQYIWQDIRFENLFINATFNNSQFINITEDEHIYGQQLTLINLNMQIYLYQSTFFLLKMVHLVTLNCIYLQYSYLIQSYLFEISNINSQNIEICQNTLQNSTLFNIFTSEQKENLFENTQISNNLYSDSSTFIQIQSPGSRVSFINLIVKGNTLKQKESLLYINHLFILNINSLYIQYMKCIREPGIPEFYITSKSNITLSNILITSNPKNKIKLLHNDQSCLLNQSINMIDSEFMQITKFSYIQIQNLYVLQLQNINQAIFIISGMMNNNQQIQSILIQNSQFTNNSIACFDKDILSGILYFQSDKIGWIKFHNILYQNNLMIDYNKERILQSSLLYTIKAPNFNVSIRFCQYINNFMFENDMSIFYISSHLTQIKDVFWNSNNLYNYSLLREYIIYGFYQDQFINNQIIQEIFSNRNYGGSGRIDSIVIKIQNCKIVNSTGYLGGSLFISGVQSLIIRDSQFINSEANIKAFDSQGGVLYVQIKEDISKVILKNISFINCSSSYKGGSIIINAENSKYINVTLLNISCFNCISLKGGVILIDTNDNANLFFKLQNFVYNSTFTQIMKLFEKQKTYYIVGYLIEITQGILILQNIDIKQNYIFGFLQCLNIKQAILKNVYIMYFQQFNSYFINLKRQPFVRGYIFIQDLKILGQEFQELYIDHDCNQQNQILSSSSEMKCIDFEAPIFMTDQYNQEQLNKLSFCSLKQFVSHFIKISLININNQGLSDKILLNKIQIININCDKCVNGLLFIGDIPQINRNIIQFEQLYIYNNYCGQLGSLVIQGIQLFERSIIINDNLDQYIIQLIDSSFINNQAVIGGALILNSIHSLIRDTIFISNRALNGGALYIQGEFNQKFINVKFSNNYGSQGQAIFLEEGVISLKSMISFEVDQKSYQNTTISQKPNYIRIIYNSKELKNTKVLDSSFILKEEILCKYKLGYQNFIYLPSGQKLNEYKFFNENNQSYLHKRINLQIILLNQQYQKEIPYQNEKCYLQIKDDIQYISTTTLIYNYTQKGYVLDDLIVRYDPFNADYLQIKVSCDSIKRQNNQKYELLFNIKTYYCQRGEYYNKSEGTCNLCDQNQLFYTVIAGGICKQMNKQFMQDITSARIKLKQGYWRPNEINDNIEYCQRNSQNCIGGWDTGNQLCQVGNIGALCEQCDIYNIKGEGRFAFKDYNQCANCGEETINYIIIIIIILGTLLSIFLSVKGTVQNIEWTTKIIKLKQIGLRIQLNKENDSSVLIKLFINYIIILSSITTFQIELPYFVNNLIIKTSNPIQSISYSIDCLLIKFYYIDILYLRQIYSILIPLIYSTMFLICFNILLILKKTKYTFSIISTSILYIYSYMQPNLIGGFISILAFRVISNIYWIQGNVSYQYFTYQHKQWLFYFIIPFLLIISILIPFSIIILLYKKQKILNKPKFRMIWGYLYIEYIDSAYYWEIIKLQQKEIIICILTFYEDLIILKSILIFLTIVLYDVISRIKQPFKKRKQNQLDQKVSQILAGSIVFAQIIYITQQYNIQQYQYPFYTLLLLINAYFMIILLSKIIIIFFSYFQNSIEILKEYLTNKLPIHKLGYTINLLFVLKKDKKRRITTRINIIRQNLFPQAKKIAMFRRQTTTMITQETLMTENTRNKSNNDIIKLISQKNNNLEQQHKLQNYPQLNQMIKLITGSISRKE